MILSRHSEEFEDCMKRFQQNFTVINHYLGSNIRIHGNDDQIEIFVIFAYI